VSEFVFAVEGTKSKQVFFSGFCFKRKTVDVIGHGKSGSLFFVFSTFYLQNSFMVVIIFFRDSFAHSQPAVDSAPIIIIS
jgi:hypothetical protein